MPDVGIVSRISTFTGLTFVVNTAVDHVTLLLAGNPDFTVNGTVGNLVQGDQCIIEGFALCCPFQFGQGELSTGGAGRPAFFQLGWIDQLGINAAVNEVGDTGRINVPDFNVWYDTYAFVPEPATVSAKYKFRILGLGGEVSMFNVPAALNTDTINICIHLKIRHTLALIA